MVDDHVSVDEAPSDARRIRAERERRRRWRYGRETVLISRTALESPPGEVVVEGYLPPC